MVSFARAALVSAFCFEAATAGKHPHVSMRQLQGYTIDAPISCYFDGATCVGDPTNTVYDLPSAMDSFPFPTSPSLVVMFPHEDVGAGGGYGTVTTTYFTEDCTTELVSSEQDLFPETSGLVAASALRATPAITPAISSGRVLSAITFPVSLLVDLPSSVNTINVAADPDEYSIKFCVRLGLTSNDSGSELGFRELDLSVALTIEEGTPDVVFTANDNDETESAFDLGDYSVAVSVCADSPGSTPLVQGEQIALCFVPQRDPDDTGDVKTTEIIIEEIQDFQLATTTPAAGLTQLVYENSVLQPDSSVAAADGNACALGLGAQTAGSPVVYDATIHGCRTLTRLTSAIYDQDSDAIGLTGSGTVSIVFRGERRKLQFNIGDSADLGTEETSFEIAGTAQANQIECNFPFIGFIICPLIRIMERLMRGGMDFVNNLF